MVSRAGTDRAAAAARAEGGRVVEPGAPGGTVYEWYQRGLQLLGERNPEAAATLLARAADAEPGSRAIREALARAQYDAGRYGEAIESFHCLISLNPSDDYAHFGLGLAASRSGELSLAAEHLALAVAMRPELGHYARALRGVRARQSAGSA